MKNFYDMWMMLESYDDDYGPISFSRILGEGDIEAPFSVEVHVEDGRWEARGGIWVSGYVPNGSEKPASKPVAYTAGQKDPRGIVSDVTGTDFENPGRRLELLPTSIRAEAVAWVDKQVEDAVRNYTPDDPRDYDGDRDDYNPDPDGHGYWDSYWRTGPGRDR